METPDGLDYETSPGDITELLKALLAAQGKLLSSLPKDTDNPYFKSKYTDLGTMLEVVRPALTDAGIVILQPTSTQNWETHQDSSESIHVVCTTMLYHAATGQWIRSRFSVPCRPLGRSKEMEGTGPGRLTPQAVGSAMSYARRYSIFSLLALASDEDDDGNASSAQSGGTRQTNRDTGEITESFGECPVHHKPFTVGKYGPHCATKLDGDGGWCKEKPQKAAQATAPPAPPEDPEERKTLLQRCSQLMAECSVALADGTLDKLPKPPDLTGPLPALQTWATAVGAKLAQITVTAGAASVADAPKEDAPF